MDMATLGEGYREFSSGSVFKTATFRHSNHWMQDVSGQAPGGVGPPWNLGGTAIRPDRTFTAENGRLVIEADVAAGVTALEGVAWPEIAISTASQPTTDRADAIYQYDRFNGHWTMGLRLEPTRTPIIAIHPPSGPRRTELSYFQSDGAKVSGGGPFDPERSASWRLCQDEDPDLACRDRFRWEISQKRMTLYVNGMKHMEHSNLSDSVDVPMELLTQPVYIYFAATTYRPEATTVRFHWGRVAVNPSSAPTSAIVSLVPVPSVGR
jgi:hypothetical protein